MQADDAERERLELLIGDVYAEMEILKVSATEPAATKSDEPRKSSQEKVNPQNAGTKTTRSLSEGE